MRINIEGLELLDRKKYPCPHYFITPENRIRFSPYTLEHFGIKIMEDKLLIPIKNPKGKEIGAVCKDSKQREADIYSKYFSPKSNLFNYHEVLSRYPINNVTTPQFYARTLIVGDIFEVLLLHQIGYHALSVFNIGISNVQRNFIANLPHPILFTEKEPTDFGSLFSYEETNRFQHYEKFAGIFPRYKFYTLNKPLKF